MELTYADIYKDDPNEGDLFHNYSSIQGSSDQKVSYISDSKAQTLVKGGKPGKKTLTLKLIHSETCENWFQELFHRRSRGLGAKIPRQLVSLDEKYLKRCLELMHMNALKGAPCSLFVNLGSFRLGFVSDCAAAARRSSDVTSCAIDYPMAIGIGDLDLSIGDEDIVGSVMGSSSMMRILRCPLFQRFGTLDPNVRLEGTNLFENKKCISSDYQGSLGRSNSSLSHKHGKESSAFRNQGYRSDSVHRSPISISSEASVLTDQCSASFLSPSGSQGMLHFIWDNGIPHFTFTLDDQKEVYVANALKVEATNDKGLDYVYSFHLKAIGRRLFDISDTVPDLIGKMRVSTAFSLSLSNSRIMETEFVLVGANYNQAKETHTFSRNSRRSRKLSKVMDVFKAGHSFKQRTPSLFGGSSAIPEDFSPEKWLEVCCNYHECKPDLSEHDFLPNLELAAIVMKDQLPEEDHQKVKLGGWGLNFLKNSGIKQNVASSECCLRNVGKCSTSMDIIVPAGPHGGPRAKNGGPTSLIERWKSGGNCDCGGWDVGCPLKILKAKPQSEEGWPSSEVQGDCKSFEMFIEGSAHGMPPLKMVNIRDGLYFISFQPSCLSALQCFSIAVAIIHSQSSSLRPKHAQD